MPFRRVFSTVNSSLDGILSLNIYSYGPLLHRIQHLSRSRLLYSILVRIPGHIDFVLFTLLVTVSVPVPSRLSLENLRQLLLTQFLFKFSTPIFCLLHLRRPEQLSYDSDTGQI